MTSLPKFILDIHCGCKCKGCGIDDAEKNLIRANGSCAWSECKRNGKPKSKEYKNYNFMQCHCSDLLPIHMHMIPRYFCTTKCERKWIASPLNKWKKDSNPNLIDNYSFGDQKVEEEFDSMLCKNCRKKEDPKERFMKCGKCKLVTYCSKNCQIIDWKKHKLECDPSIKSQ